MEFSPRAAFMALSALSALLAVTVILGGGARGEVVPGEAAGLTCAGAAISSSGPPVAVIGIGASAGSTSGESLLGVRLDIRGAGFSSDDLSPLSPDPETSGVALYRDDGTTGDALDSSDTPVSLSGCTWNGGTAVLLLEKGSERVPQYDSGRFQWLLVIRAGANLTDGDEISVSLPSGGVLFSDQTTMPDCDVSALNLTADSSPPGEWTELRPEGWTNLSRTPDISIRVRDALAGLEAGTAAYQYSTDGGGSWSEWLPASISGVDGSTDAETLTAVSVQFCQDSSEMNVVRFRVSDRAQNVGESDWCVVRIDTVAPGGWSDFGPSGWFRQSQTPTVDITVRDATSGLSTDSARLQYSTDGGKSWSGWVAVGVGGENGTSDTRTITGQSVPFWQDSPGLNQVRFRIADLAGNSATSAAFTVWIDTASPDGWRVLMPAGWTVSTQEPEVSVQVDDVTSGLDPRTALFQYSIDGGRSWSAWAEAELSEEGRLVAAAVPFGRDSANLNLVRFKVGDFAGNNAHSQDYIIRIDTAGPGEWGELQPSGWCNGTAQRALTIRVRDTNSGVAPGSAWYRTSADGGITWSDWSGALLEEESGDNGFRTALADGVRFPRDSGTLNLIEFMVGDAAGNMGRSGPLVVRTDATPPGSWTGFSPSGWVLVSRAPTATVWVRDLGSGLQNGTAGYQYSADGGLTWSDWRPAVLDGPGGTTAFRTIMASAVPFGTDSGGDTLVRFRVTDLAGNTGESPAYAVRIDTESPGGWAEFTPSGWFGRSRSPTVTVSVRDLTSGLDGLSGQYRYSTDGGIVWSDWLSAAVAPAWGALSPCTLTAADVPFGQDSGQLNKIMFRVADLAGNLGSSTAYTIRIDTATPGGWEALSPSGWYGQTGSMTVRINGRDATSGILPGRAEFQCSYDGGATWGDWLPAELEGTTTGPGARTLVAANLSFDGLSPGAGRIRFRLVDLAGNVGTSPDYPVLVDTSPPGGWTGAFPGGWFTLTRQPTLTTQVEDRLSGLDVHGAEYRYSTDGGATWSAWRPAALSGWNGAVGPLTITATCVPFGRDSGTDNLVQFRARDMAGNIGESPAYAVRIDTTAPSCSLHPPPTSIASRTIRLLFDVADTGSGPESVELWYRYEDGALTLYSTAGASDLLVFVAPSDGRYGLYLRARDAAGNLQPLPASPGASFTVDTVAPAIELEVRTGEGGLARVTGHTEPLALLRINGRAVAVDPSGSFAVDLPVHAGQNSITASATDIAGNSATVSEGLVAPDRSPDGWLAVAAGAGLAMGAVAAAMFWWLRGRRAA